MEGLTVMTPTQLDTIIGSLKNVEQALKAPYWEELLDSKGIAKDWGVSPETIRKIVKKPSNPLPKLRERLGRMTRREAREWRDKNLMKYSEAHQ